MIRQLCGRKGPDSSAGKAPIPPFAERVLEGMRERGLGLRRLCREVGLDPSFFSKVLSGKRSPPAEEAALRRIAGALGLDPEGLIVSAGRVPSEWAGLWRDRGLFEEVRRLISGERPREARRPAAGPPAPASRKPAIGREERGPRPAPEAVWRPSAMGEELL